MSRSIITDRKKSAVNKHWSAKDKVRAVATFLVVGNMSVVSEQTGIPLGTLSYWKSMPWWYEQIEKIKAAEDQEIDNTFTNIVKKTQSVILDRLENGDFHVDSEGHIFRKPVSMKDSAIVAGISIEKRKLIRDTPVSDNKVGMSERLKRLEEEFTKMVTSKTIEGEVLEVISEPIEEIIQ